MTSVARGGKYQVNIKQCPPADLLILHAQILTVSKDVAADTWLSSQSAASPLPQTANQHIHCQQRSPSN